MERTPCPSPVVPHYLRVHRGERWEEERIRFGGNTERWQKICSIGRPTNQSPQTCLHGCPIRRQCCEASVGGCWWSTKTEADGQQLKSCWELLFETAKDLPTLSLECHSSMFECKRSRVPRVPRRSTLRIHPAGQSDCSTVVKAITSHYPSRAALGLMIQEIQNILRHVASYRMQIVAIAAANHWRTE
jgi:hypothetical protein